MQKYHSVILALDGEQLLDDLDQLAGFDAGTGKGINRIAYTSADRAGRDWIEARMRELGMDVRVDAVGNTIAHYPGSEPALRPIALGSHTDTVPDGGKYDGALGVLSALACVRTLCAAGIMTRHPIEVINFAAEEATLLGGIFGSRAMAAILPSNVLQQAAWDGRTVDEHLRTAGLDPLQFQGVARPVGSLAAYLELHIEQGGILDTAGMPIGIVQGIVGIRSYLATFLGYTNHAGTTPMSDRRDALVGAAPLIPMVRDLAVRRGIVGTIGAVYVTPGASNVIPGQVDMPVEIRSLNDAELDAAADELAECVATLGGRLREVSRKAPEMSDQRLMDALTAASDELGLAHRTLASGAGHDAMCMARIAPMAMLFVPSRGGVSHSPDEYTEPEHCINGARVLLGALLKLDGSLDSQ